MNTVTNVIDRREQDFLNYRESLIVDEQTWAAENLDAPLEKPLSYTFRNNELWSEHQQPLGDIFSNSVEHYRRLAAAKPELMFQYRRALAEQHEYEHMKAMARGDAPNTFVAISPLPRELKGAQDDVLGYQPRRALGFIRVMTRQANGSIRMWTHSIDRSDNERALNAMYSYMGMNIDLDRDALEQPVVLDLPADEQELLGDQLLKQYDGVFQHTHGGHWFAGRNDMERREAVAFVSLQHDLVNAHVDALIHAGPTSVTANKLRYDFAAAVRRRFEGDFRFAGIGSVASEMASAGGDAMSRGETASGCGVSISVTTENQLSQAGYKVEEKREFKYGVCVACIKPGMVGECSVCIGCEIDDNHGVDLLKRRKEALSSLQRQHEQKADSTVNTFRSTPSSRNQEAEILAAYGSNTQLKRELTLGGINSFVINKSTGDVLAKL